MKTGLDQRVQETDPSENARKTESYLIDLIDKADTVRRHEKLIEKLNTGTLEVPGFLKAISANAALKVLHLMESGESEKIQLEAAKDILDRAGFNKTQKVAVGHMNIDHQTSKRELINMIMSAARKAGVKTKEVPNETVIDVTPPNVDKHDELPVWAEGKGEDSGTSSEQVCQQDGKPPHDDSD